MLPRQPPHRLPRQAQRLAETSGALRRRADEHGVLIVEVRHRDQHAGPVAASEQRSRGSAVADRAHAPGAGYICGGSLAGDESPEETIQKIADRVGLAGAILGSSQETGHAGGLIDDEQTARGTACAGRTE